MKPLYVTSDLHLSAIRSAGTTPQTAAALRQHLLQGFSAILDACDSDVLLNGDFADSYKMVPADILEAYHLIDAWLKRGHMFYAVPGNHCLSKSAYDLSSFELLFRLLQAQHPEQVKLFMQPGPVRDDMYALGHVQNQDILDTELAKVPPGTSYLFLHANFSNPFAQRSDHSLDVSEAQAKESPAKILIFGHEHVRREALKGKVQIVGNPFPSSVSDCLHNDKKYMIKVSDTGIEYVQTWQAAGDFSEQDWQALQDDGARFIRVIGSATAAQAPEVVSAISKFRSKSDALVITNAVKVEGVADQDELEMSAEQLAAFDVKSALLELLSKPEAAVVEKLLEEENV